jgi:hypothetical protein
MFFVSFYARYIIKREVYDDFNNPRNGLAGQADSSWEIEKPIALIS